MELNGDGHLDLLSGCYSRHDADMAGLFQVCWGSADGLRPPEALRGDDGKELIITTSGAGDTMVQKICTRPVACDLDGDGKLDLVSGNFGGTFAFFQGLGGGKFAAKSTWLQAGGGEMHVPHHSDPFVIDWDGDGDLDILSGSSSGGVFLFANAGSKTAPKFGARQTLLPEHQHSEDLVFGDAHLKGPQGSTRIWVADVDGDQKLDLLVGDQVTLIHVAKGVTEAEATAKLKDWRARQQQHFQAQKDEPTEAEQKAWMDTYHQLEKEREAFAPEQVTGFVWLLRQK